MNRRGGLHPNPTYVWTRAHKSPKPSGWFLAVPHNRPPMPFLRPPCPTADESHECRPGLQAAMEEPDWNHDQPRRLPNVENLIILGFKSTQIKNFKALLRHIIGCAEIELSKSCLQSVSDVSKAKWKWALWNWKTMWLFWWFCRNTQKICYFWSHGRSFWGFTFNGKFIQVIIIMMEEKYCKYFWK